MAPTSNLHLHLLPRQFGNNDGNGPFGDRDGPPNGGFSTWAILGIVITVAAIALIIGLFFLSRYRQRRRRAAAVSSAIHLAPTSAPKPPSASNPSADPSKYGGSTGYGVTPDQGHSLLGNAEAPAIVTWDADHAAAGSTQDGFGYDNNLNLAGAPAIQRPASVASFSAPPPRYEEATASGSGSNSLRPQGDAASYFNSGISMGERERGRSVPRDGRGDGAGRERALSVDQRGVNGNRRRSTSRFREEGMVDVNVDGKM